MVVIIRDTSVESIFLEPEWVEVLLEMLLSVLSEKSLMGRTIQIIFTALVPHLTAVSIDLLVDVSNNNKYPYRAILFTE